MYLHALVGLGVELAMKLPTQLGRGIADFYDFWMDYFSSNLQLLQNGQRGESKANPNPTRAWKYDFSSECFRVF